ncbi:membrane protein insertion efficiency factor YidD [bacterium]|nr:MAG: membrane protein insertion efficiency factor YidD [bacterium]
MRRVFLAAAIALMASTALAGWNQQGWEKTRAAEGKDGANPLLVAENGLLSLYKNVLGPVNSGKCPSSPTCSAYARKAVNIYGPLVGVTLTANRLLGENDEWRFSPVIFTDKPRIYSPPERDYEFLTGER